MGPSPWQPAPRQREVRPPGWRDRGLAASCERSPSRGCRHLRPSRNGRSGAYSIHRQRTRSGGREIREGASDRGCIRVMVPRRWLLASSVEPPGASLISGERARVSSPLEPPCRECRGSGDEHCCTNRGGLDESQSATRGTSHDCYGQSPRRDVPNSAGRAPGWRGGDRADRFLRSCSSPGSPRGSRATTRRGRRPGSQCCPRHSGSGLHREDGGRTRGHTVFTRGGSRGPGDTAL